jgi:hypothetical protein
VVDKRSKRMSLRLKKSTANVISSMAQQAPMSTQRAPKTPAYSPDQLVVEIVVPGFDTAYAEVCFDQSTVVVAVLTPIHLVVVLLLLPRTSLSLSLSLSLSRSLALSCLRRTKNSKPPLGAVSLNT